MKETLTLLERCQREAREKLERVCDQYGETFNALPEGDVMEIIANTLKQAAEALEGMKNDDLPSSVKDPAGFCKGIGYNQALTDAQRLLLGEDNKIGL